MMFDKKEITKTPKELQKARETFQQVLVKDKHMGLLLLVDPIRAFGDAGIKLSPQTRQYIRRKNPQFAYGNNRLYDAIKDGKIKPQWIKSVKFHFDNENNK